MSSVNPSVWCDSSTFLYCVAWICSAFSKCCVCFVKLMMFSCVAVGWAPRATVYMSYQTETEIASGKTLSEQGQLKCCNEPLNHSFNCEHTCLNNQPAGMFFITAAIRLSHHWPAFAVNIQTLLCISYQDYLVCTIWQLKSSFLQRSFPVTLNFLELCPVHRPM